MCLHYVHQCVLGAQGGQKVALGALELELQWLWTHPLQQQVLLTRALFPALIVHVLHIMKYLTDGWDQITLSGTLVVYIMSRHAGSLYQVVYELHKRSIVDKVLIMGVSI